MQYTDNIKQIHFFEVFYSVHVIQSVLLFSEILSLQKHAIRKGINVQITHILYVVYKQIETLQAIVRIHPLSLLTALTVIF